MSLVGLLLVAEGAAAVVQLGVVGFCWLVGGTTALVVLGILLARQSWTTVGPAGITIRRGVGRGRTYPWQEIRWIDVREIGSQNGTALAARITLANGRRRILPALHHSPQYPDPGFYANYGRVVKWWKASTDPAARFQPPKRLRDRLTPTVVGLILGLLIVVVVGLVTIEG